MAEKIVSRSFSKQGRDNWDKIFKKKKQIEPLTIEDNSCKFECLDCGKVVDSSHNCQQKSCEDCFMSDGWHRADCRNYLG